MKMKKKHKMEQNNENAKYDKNDVEEKKRETVSSDLTHFM